MNTCCYCPKQATHAYLNWPFCYECWVERMIKYYHEYENMTIEDVLNQLDECLAN